MTTAEQPPASPPPSTPSPRRRRGRWWKILLAILAIILLLALFAPTALSTSAGKNVILNQVNARIAGTIQADALSLGWFSGISARNLVVKDPQGHDVLTVPTLDTGLSLLDAVGGSYSNLHLLLHATNVTIIENPDGTNNLTNAFAARKAPTPSAAPAATQPHPAQSASSSSRLPAIHATIDARIDTINISSPAAPPVTISGLTAKGILDTGGATTLALDAQARTGNQPPAAIAAKADGNFFTAGKLKPLGQLTGTASATMQSLDLAAITPLLQSAGLKLQLTGMAAADFNLGQTNGKQVATGKITIDHLVATGDLLQGDTFKRNAVTITLDSSLNGDAIDLHPLALNTDGVSLQATGSIGTSTATANTTVTQSAGASTPPVTLVANINVTQLKSELPHLLGSLPDTQASLNLSGSMNSAQKIFEVTADSTIAEKDPKTALGNTLTLQKGSLLSWGSAANNIHAIAAVSWPRTQAILASRLPQGTLLEGQRSIPLHIVGALVKAPGLAAFKDFQIDPTAVGFDRIYCKGFTIGKFDLPIQMKQSILTLTPTDIPANNGKIHLAGRVDFTQTPPAYILDKGPQPTQIIQGLELNKEIAADPLSFLPLAWGATGAKKNALGTVAGQLNVFLDGASIPLDSATLKQKGASAGTLTIDNLTTDAPAFTQLLRKIGPIAQITQPDLLAIKGGSIPNTPFHLSNGKVSYQNLTIGTKVLAISFSGSVGLDNSMALNVSVTIGGVQLPIPIGLGGTTSNPRITIAGGSNIGQDIAAPIQSLGNDLNNLFGGKKKKK